MSLFSLLFYAYCCCRTVWFGDSGELIQAASTFGLAHPPGYPLYTLLGGAAMRILPIGEPAFRMNLLSALFAALSCGLTAHLVFRWVSMRSAAWVAALSLMLATPLWRQAVIAEVYTLHLLLLLLMIGQADRMGERERSRDWIGLALLLGCALAHRPTALLLLPTLWMLVGGTVRRRLSIFWRVGLLAPLVSLPLYATLPWRAARPGASSWADVDRLETLWAHMMTAQYRHYDLGWSAYLKLESWSAAAQTLWPATLFVGPALMLFAWAPNTRKRSIALATFAALQLLFALRYATADIEVLYLPMLIAGSMLIALGWANWMREPSSFRRALGWLVAVAMISAGLLYGWPQNNLRGRNAAADYAAQMLEQLPQGATAFVQGDDTFLLAYRMLTLGERPDLTLFDRNGQLFEDELRRPGLSRGEGESLPDWRIRRERSLVQQALVQPGGAAPLYFMSWPGYELAPGGRFVPDGLWWRVAREPIDSASSRQLDPELWERLRIDAELTEDSFARSVAALYPMMRAERELFFSGEQAAERWFDEALSIDPTGESTLNALGTAYGRRGRFADAVQIFERLTAAHPASVRGWSNLATARRLAGDLQGAAAAQARAVRLSSQDY